MTMPEFLGRKFRPDSAGVSRPVIGVLCCNETVDRPVQLVASRFIEPLSRIAEAGVLLVPALADINDLAALCSRLDGLLLTGSRSNLGAHYYGATDEDTGTDPQRDQIALALAEQMIVDGRPVFGICRGLQELNVLFGGSLMRTPGEAHHRGEDGLAFADLFEHSHDVMLSEGGVLHGLGEGGRIRVNSVHHQGIDRLGGGLTVEAISPDDGLIEAFSARPCGTEVLAVQWHPEWNGAQGLTNRGFFERIGLALRSHAHTEPQAWLPQRGH